MRRFYFFLCPIPAISFLLYGLSTNGYLGGPYGEFCMCALVLFLLLCPVITLMGLILISVFLYRRAAMVGLIIGTLIAALPAIVLMFHNPFPLSGP